MREKIEAILKQILKKKNIDFNEVNTDKLITNNIISSLDLMELISNLSDAFNVEFDYTDISTENFNSLEKIVELIRNKEGKI